MKPSPKKLDMKLLVGLLIALTAVAISAHNCKGIKDIRSDIANETAKIVQKRERLLLIGLLIGMTEAPKASVHTIRQGMPESPESDVPSFPFVSRTEWGARLPQDVLPLTTPVPYVIIHHSYIIKACNKRRACCEAMRDIQDYHMDYRGWWDIGYNFGVGGDGAAYEGRGWSILGAHALHWNNISIGICVIGDWSVCSPPENQLRTVQALIASGVQRGYIRQDYQLIGHRQTRSTTQCPGTALYQAIQSWKHWTDDPIWENANATSVGDD